MRVAVVGTGIAERHIRGYGWRQDLFEVAVLCSRTPERGQPMARKYGIPDYSTSFAEVIARDDIDIVDLCTPPTTHLEFCRQALAAGKHVICEKPLVGSLADVDRLQQAVAASSRLLMPIFQFRYGTGLQKLKYLVGLGLAGQPYMTTIETHWWRGADYYAVPWRGKWATELGGALLGHAIHAHDMLNYVHGPCAEIFALLDTKVNDIEVEDTAALAVRMANGSLASLSLTLGSREEISRLRFCFRDLVAESIRQPYTMADDPWAFIAGDDASQRRVDAALAAYEPKEYGYTRQFELFHEAIETGGAPPVTLDDARASLELVTAAYHSQRTRRPERLPITPGHPLYESWLPEA